MTATTDGRSGKTKTSLTKRYSMMAMTLRSLVEATSSSTSSTGYITDARRQPAITKRPVLPMIMAESPAERIGAEQTFMRIARREV